MDTFWKKWVVAFVAVLIVGSFVLVFVPVPAAAPSGPVAAAGVALGQQTTIGGVLITPLELVEDSRCPVDVQCIQAGTVRVRVAINALSRDFTFTLGEPQTVGDATITLSAVSPTEKYSTITVLPDEYLFVFTVKKGESSNE